MATQVIQVFEHQVLRVGAKQGNAVFRPSHLQALEQLTQQHGQKFFTLLPRAVRFKQYVGAIGLGDVTIEVLPKLEVDTADEPGSWQAILLDLLQRCRLVDLVLVGEAKLQLERKPSFLSLFVDLFLQKVQRFIIEGLPKHYRRQQANQPFLRGRLLVAPHLAHNQGRHHRFYTDAQAFTFDHPLNQLLQASLWALAEQWQLHTQQPHLRALAQHFQQLGVSTHHRFNFQQLRLQYHDPQTLLLIDWCQLILQHFRPGLSGGRHALLAILFDMNALFEEYIYRVLRQAIPTESELSRQVAKPFWRKQYIRPDLVLQQANQCYVLDTKWKQLITPKPSSESLKQLYVYANYFEAQQAILIYPATASLKGSTTTPFQPTPTDSTPPSCKLIFAEVLKNGTLNQQLGQELKAAILS